MQTTTISAHKPTRPLTMADLNKRDIAQITGVASGTEANKFSIRLRELGFVEGTQVDVFARQNGKYGSMIVEIGGTRFTLRKTLAEMITCKKTGERPEQSLVKEIKTSFLKFSKRWLKKIIICQKPYARF